MPFSGPSSYLSTIDEFIGHWLDVNLALAPGNLTLPGPYALANLQNDRDKLSDEITDLVVATNVVEGHRTDRDNRKEATKERMRQLGAVVRGLLAGSNAVGRVPPPIDLLANSGKWLIALRDHENLWSEINTTPPPGFTPPLILTGGYTLAMFTIDKVKLETTFEDLSLAEQDVDREVKERDQLYLAIRDELVLYRQAVPGLFPAGHALILSLPRLTPLPGHTPDAVVLSGVWNGTTVKADLAWTASADPDFDHYSLRRSGPPYNTNTEIVVADFPAGTLVASTNEGLTVPGSSMAFKLYVVLNTGNEKGSNAVTVTHETVGPPPPP